jgi:hypothetical protein
MQKLLLVLIPFFSHTYLFGQNTPDKIKITLAYTDSFFFDRAECALFSKTSGSENRFKTLKQCTLIYKARNKSGVIVLKKNKLPKTIEKLIDNRCRKIELKFTDIVLAADDLNPTERKCPPFTITYYYRRSWWFYFGVSGKIPSPIPTFIYDKTTIDYPETE